MMDRIPRSQETTEQLLELLRRLTLENLIYRSAATVMTMAELSALLSRPFASEHLILVVIRAQADPMRRHTAPGVQAATPEVAPTQPFYSEEAMDAAEEVIRAALLPQTEFELFRIDRDLGLLLNPNAGYISETHITDGGYYRELVSKIGEAVRVLDGQLSYESCASISALHSHGASLREMYLETKSIFDYSWNLPGAIHTYPELRAMPLSSEDQKEISALEQEFMGHINHLLFFEASLVLENILQKQYAHAVPLEEIIVAVTSRLRNVFAIVTYATGLSLEDIETISDLIAKVAQSESIPELEDRIHDFFASLSDVNPRQQVKKVQQVLEFIEANYKNPALSAQMICDRFRFSQTYLSRVLKKETGQGLVERIHDIRVQHAKPLLAETSLGVEQIALQVGFSNRYGLIRAFREIEGCTPSEYRQQRPSAPPSEPPLS